MKKLLIISFIAAFAMAGCEQKPSYTINAEFTGQTDAAYILMQLIIDDEITTVDSVPITNSKVQFKGVLEGPQMVYLRVGESKKVVNFFGENSKIDIKVNLDDLENTIVTGSVVHDDFMAFKDYLKPIDERNDQLRDDIREASQNGDVEKIKELRRESEVIYNDQQKMLFDYTNAVFYIVN